MKHILTNILKILTKEEQRKLGVFTFLNITISILDIAFLALLLAVIDFYTGGRFSQSFLKNYPLLPIAVFLFFFIAKNIIASIIFKSQYDFVYNVASRMSGKNLLHYLEGNYLDFVDLDSSVSIRKIGHQPIEFSQNVLTGIQQIVTQGALIFFTLVAILIYNAQLFLLLFIILLPPVFLMGYINRKKLKLVRAQIKPTSQKSIQHLQEALSGFIESNLYDKNSFFTTRYYTDQYKLNSLLSDHQTIQAMPSRLMEIFAILGLFILILLNNSMGHTHMIQIITLGAFIAAAYKVIPGVVKILNSWGQIKTYQFVINDQVQINNSYRKKGANKTEKIASVEFEDVCYKYADSDVISNLNLQIKAGDFIGIQGLSGKGKTTIINLLLGFLSPATGIIKINNNVTDDSERRQHWNDISYVKQQSFLIHDTILKNIVLDESYDQEKLYKAINISGLDSLINSAPAGLEKLITEKGGNISGGQQQRISIARALYKNAGLIILDEPFNELDNASEVAILKELQLMTSKGKIVVLITHHKKSLDFCTKIISIDGAR